MISLNQLKIITLISVFAVTNTTYAGHHEERRDAKRYE